MLKEVKRKINININEAKLLLNPYITNEKHQLHSPPRLAIMVFEKNRARVFLIDGFGCSYSRRFNRASMIFWGLFNQFHVSFTFLCRLRTSGVFLTFSGSIQMEHWCEIG